MNKISKRKIIGSIGILTLLVMSIAVADVITVSGNCTGTTLISMTNYTFTGQCTGQITTPSSSSSTSVSTTTRMTTQTNNEILDYVYGTNGCQPILVPTSITYVSNNFTATNNQWQIDAYFYDSIHNYTLIGGLTTQAPTIDTISGEIYTHEFVGLFISPELTISVNIPIDNNYLGTNFGLTRSLTSNIQAKDNLDFYFDGDSLQGIWYVNNTQGINDELIYLDLPSDINFTTTAIVTGFASLGSNQNPVIFSPNTSMILQQGNLFQQRNGTNVPGMIQLTSSTTPHCTVFPPLSINANICEQTTGTQNTGTMIVEKMYSV